VPKRPLYARVSAAQAAGLERPGDGPFGTGLCLAYLVSLVTYLVAYLVVASLGSVAGRRPPLPAGGAPFAAPQ
jgi:hypothetical protein